MAEDIFHGYIINYRAWIERGFEWQKTYFMDMLSLISLDRKGVSIGDKKDNSGMRTDSEKKKKLVW